VYIEKSNKSVNQHLTKFWTRMSIVSQPYASVQCPAKR